MSSLAMLLGAIISSGGGGGGGGGGGSSPGTVTLSNQSIIKSGKSVSYVISSDGNVYDNLGNLLQAWLTGGVASNYEVEAVLVSGSITSGTLGSWLSCSTSNSWRIGVSLGSDQSATLTVSIRDASTKTVRASASIYIEANSVGQTGGS